MPRGELRLTAREAALLRHLAERPGRTVGADALLVDVWVWGTSRASRRGRSRPPCPRPGGRVERDPARPDHLRTARGERCRFVPLAEPDAAAALDPEARRRAMGLRAERAGHDDPAAALADLNELPEESRAGRLARTTRGSRSSSRRSGSGVDPSAEEWLRAATSGSDGAAIRPRVRLGVLMLDAGRLDGWDELRRASETVLAGATRLEAMAPAEQGPYAVLRGTPDDAVALLEPAGALALRARATYTERREGSPE